MSLRKVDTVRLSSVSLHATAKGKTIITYIKYNVLLILLAIDLEKIESFFRNRGKRI